MTNFYPNQIEAAEKMFLMSMLKKSSIVALIAEPQSGKTGADIKYVEKIFEWISKKHVNNNNLQAGFAPNSGVLLLLQTTNSNSLESQTIQRYKDAKYEYTIDLNGQQYPIKILGKNLNLKTLKYSTSEKKIESIKKEDCDGIEVVIICVDEAHKNNPSDGKLWSHENNIIKELIKLNPNLTIIMKLTTATPAGLRSSDGKLFSYVCLQPGESYYGVRDFIINERIKDGWKLFKSKNFNENKNDHIVYANVAIEKFKNDVLMPELILQEKKKIGVLRLESQRQYDYFLSVIKTDKKIQKMIDDNELIIQLFSSHSHALPIKDFNSEENNSWLGKASKDVTFKQYKLAVLIDGFKEGDSLYSKHHIAFWYDSTFCKKININTGLLIKRKVQHPNSAGAIQSIGRNFGYPVNISENRDIHLSSLSYYIYTDKKCFQEAAKFYETAEKYEDCQQDISYDEFNNTWTNSSVKYHKSRSWVEKEKKLFESLENAQAYIQEYAKKHQTNIVEETSVMRCSKGKVNNLAQNYLYKTPRGPTWCKGSLKNGERVGIIHFDGPSPNFENDWKNLPDAEKGKYVVWITEYKNCTKEKKNKSRFAAKGGTAIDRQKPLLKVV